jgi:AcrR family transcriptional regulator
MSATGDEDAGRVRQRRRTRAAIVNATADLLAAARTPSIAEIADAADVSRRTIYEYFPTVEQLFLDATLGRLSQQEVDAAIDTADAGRDPEARVDAMIRALSAITSRTMPLGRTLLKLTVDAPAPPPDGTPRRGYRRVGWLERALEPVRARLHPAAYERLISALAMVVGWEGLIVLSDVRGLEEDEQLEVARWAARSLIDAALREAEDVRRDQRSTRTT